MWKYILLFIISSGIVNCQECDKPNVAVIVVASVFSTLAVVLLVFGIIFFILWKRRRDLLKPESTPIKRNHLVEDQDVDSPIGGVANPAFNDSDLPADISLAEEGVGGYVRCQEQTSPAKKKSPQTAAFGQGPVHKPWSSLPTSDIPPGLQRNGSVGSFDDTFFSVDPEVTSVWLQSQDFIGLGFNIAGSMRDGIFVSQVHNRGPAVESGQFKVGDRILSVTISFENMVYEDALTILSYASPYPVRVTLQKEKLVRKDRRISETPSTLSHPLYRSQSLNTLKKIRKDSTFIPIPQRSFSEMRPEKKKNGHQKSSSSTLMPPTNTSFPTIQENGRNTDSKVLNDEDVFQVSKETVVVVEKESSRANVPSVTVDMVDEKDGKSTEDSTATVFAAQLFDKLNEQDKLDMLRLSYEDPNDDLNNSKIVVSSAETSFTETRLSVDSIDSDSTVVEPKSPPIKPERRKKKTSSCSSLSSNDQPNSPRLSSFTPPEAEPIQEVIASAKTQTVESQPKSVTSYDEISEEIITPEIKDRKITVTSDNIEFSDIDVTVLNESSRSSPDIGSRTLVDYSLSDMESTMRPTTPNNGPVIEEDVITPEHAKRDSSEQPLANLLAVQGTPTDNSRNSSLESDGKNDTIIKASNSSSSLSGSDDEKNESKLQNTSEVDFNVTSSNPNLFSTPYPSRNTKEAVSGMSYDISMNELNDIESQMSQKSKLEKNKPKGGIAFEVRDDFTSGVARTVSVESKSSTVVRTMSCFDKIGNVEQTEKTIQMMRTGSFTDYKKDADDSSLDWSGKRLVRSGSFSDIPQDDSVKDWRDHNIDDSDTVNSESSLRDDVISSNDSINEMEPKGLKSSNFFRARENLANLSDYSESMQSLQSLTESSSRSSTPPPPYTANGKDNGFGSSPDSVKLPNNLSTSGMIINTDNDNNIIPTVKNENKENIRVSVSLTGHEDDTEC